MDCISYVLSVIGVFAMIGFATVVIFGLLYIADMANRNITEVFFEEEPDKIYICEEKLLEEIRNSNAA